MWGRYCRLHRLDFVGDAVLDHLITKHLFFMYTHLPPGRLTVLRAAAVNNENFARVAVKHNLHVLLKHCSSALDKQEVESELSKPRFNSFGLGDCKAPKVLGDIIESIAGSIFLDSKRDTSVVWKASWFSSVASNGASRNTSNETSAGVTRTLPATGVEGIEYKAT